jgi:DinB family protein
MARELTVDEIMAILPETPRRIAALTEGLTPGELRRPPEPASWSINDVLAHLRACHDVLGGYMLGILAEDTPTWKVMNPRTWMKKTDYPDWEFARAFEAFRKQRAELLAVLLPAPQDAWTRIARVRGVLGDINDRSVRYYGDWMAGHERARWKHIARIVAALGAEGAA